MKPYKNIKVDGITYSEHRYIWAQAYGPIPPGYVVHHINHKKRDNRLENLELMTYEEHARHHNDKHARIKMCVVCETEYEPHPTKRRRQQTCSPACQRELQSARAFERYSGTDELTIRVTVHVRALVAGGMTQRAIAYAAGVSNPAVSKLASGRTKRVKPATAARLLAVHAAVIGAATGLDWRSAVESEYAPADLEGASA